MSVREAIDAAVEQEQPESDDEIVSAIYRQLDVLEGTAVIIGNALTMLTLQIQNLRAEVKLFDTPQQGQPTQPQEKVQATPSGGIVESTLPAQERLPGFCGHPDAVLLDTRNGPTRVCPDCDE